MIGLKNDPSAKLALSRLKNQGTQGLSGIPPKETSPRMMQRRESLICNTQQFQTK
jgi:hypothetical protein